MSYKRIELSNLEKMTELTGRQLENVCLYLKTMDNLQQIPLLSDAVTIHELMQSTSSLLTLTNSLIIEEAATAYAKDMDTPHMFGGVLNIPNTITHSLNLEELDRDFDTEIDDSDFDEDDEDDDRDDTTAA